MFGLVFSDFTSDWSGSSTRFATESALGVEISPEISSVKADVKNSLSFSATTVSSPSALFAHLSSSSWTAFPSWFPVLDVFQDLFTSTVIFVCRQFLDCLLALLISCLYFTCRVLWAPLSLLKQSIF